MSKPKKSPYLYYLNPTFTARCLDCTWVATTHITSLSSAILHAQTTAHNVVTTTHIKYIIYGAPLKTSSPESTH